MKEFKWKTMDRQRTVCMYASEEGQAEDMQEFYEMNKNDFLCVAGCMNATGLGICQ
jgi:hypothetical protein